jgi:hypothetical protein
VRLEPMKPAPPVMMNLGLDAVVVFVIEKLVGRLCRTPGAWQVIK